MKLELEIKETEELESAIAAELKEEDKTIAELYEDTRGDDTGTSRTDTTETK